MRHREPFSNFSFPRAAEIYDACLELFDGDRDAAWGWLTFPAFGLGYARPIDYAKTEAGAMEVRNLIGRLEDGVVS
jgi:putative toxin-antitoxin system antitoxin component (TIGR02293 family)